MDSGNSGSIQSSSGGDEEYDSRAAHSISAFGHLSNPPPPKPQPPSSHHQNNHPSSTIFDPLPNYFDPSFDPMWTKTLIRSDSPSCTYGSLPLPSSAAVFTTSSSSPTVPFESPKKTEPVQTGAVRNPKKRSRASRRAPTTVLTTDTTNFRAMVQEFTGIPAPPFTSSTSPFLKTRLDLFGAPSTTRSYPLADGLQPPPYVLRPFAQKPQPPPFLGPNTDDVVSGNNSSVNHGSNFQMQNQILSFQSLLQSPMANSSILRSSGQDLLEIPSNNDEMNQTVWGGGMGLSDGDQSQHLRSVNGDYVDYSQSGNGGKVNYEKGPENVAGRGAGMVESWLCSSDH